MEASLKNPAKPKKKVLAACLIILACLISALLGSAIAGVVMLNKFDPDIWAHAGECGGWNLHCLNAKRYLDNEDLQSIATQHSNYINTLSQARKFRIDEISGAAGKLNCRYAENNASNLRTFKMPSGRSFTVVQEGTTPYWDWTAALDLTTGKRISEMERQGLQYYLYKPDPLNDQTDFLQFQHPTVAFYKMVFLDQYFNFKPVAVYPDRNEAIYTFPGGRQYIFVNDGGNELKIYNGDNEYLMSIDKRDNYTNVKICNVQCSSDTYSDEFTTKDPGAIVLERGTQIFEQKGYKLVSFDDHYYLFKFIEGKYTIVHTEMDSKDILFPPNEEMLY